MPTIKEYDLEKDKVITKKETVRKTDFKSFVKDIRGNLPTSFRKGKRPATTKSLLTKHKLPKFF